MPRVSPLIFHAQAESSAWVHRDQARVTSEIIEKNVQRGYGTYSPRFQEALYSIIRVRVLDLSSLLVQHKNSQNGP